MNDSELESKLKGVPLPERTEEYWENFPTHVRSQLRRNPASNVRESWLTQFVWKISFRFACVAVALFFLSQPLRSASAAIFKNEKLIRQELAQLPGHLRVFMADEHGLHYLVADEQ